MLFSPANPGSVAVFLAIVVAVVGMFLGGVWRVHGASPLSANRATMHASLWVGAWLGLVCAFVATGWPARLPFSGIPFFFGGVLLVSIAAGLSRLGGRLAHGLPVGALVGFQAFRLPLELVLHSWGTQGTIPSTMTWSGQNLDIISGIVALVAAPIAGRSRAIAWTANLVGSILLLNVMRVALLSAPVPFGWNVTPPLLVALHLPYALIGPVCVGGALTGHIILTRALLRRVGG